MENYEQAYQIGNTPSPQEEYSYMPQPMQDIVEEDMYSVQMTSEQVYAEDEGQKSSDILVTHSDENAQSEENQNPPSPPPSNDSTEASEPTQSKENRFHGKIFVGGLGRNTTEHTLKAYFQQFGPLSESNVICDKASGRSRGFGFVTFQSDAAVKKCLEQKHYVDGVKVDVRNAVPREEAKESTPSDSVDHPGRVFVGGLSEEVTEDQFKEFFQQFGPLKSSNLMYDKDHHKPRGFGFIIFEKPEDADKCLGIHETLGRNCEAKKALPKPTYTRPKPSYSPLWPHNPYLQMARPLKQPPRLPAMAPYREPAFYDTVDPYYLSAYGSSHFEPHMYPPQGIPPYYSAHDPMVPQQGYAYGYANTPPSGHAPFGKYPQASRGDMYSSIDHPFYGADRARRNLLRTHPY